MESIDGKFVVEERIIREILFDSIFFFFIVQFEIRVSKKFGFTRCSRSFN